MRIIGVWAFIFGIVILHPAYGQKLFQGKIIYKVEPEDKDNAFLQTMLPEAYEYWIKGDKVKLVIKGGVSEAVMNEVLYLPDEKAAYVLKYSDKTAYFLDLTPDSESLGSLEVKEDEIKVIPTQDYREILGFLCRLYHYHYLSNNEEVAISADLWVTDKFKHKIPEFDRRLGIPQLNYPGIEGLPLMVKMNTQLGKLMMNILVTASVIEYFEPDDALFKLPGNYEVKNFNEFYNNQ